MATYKLEYSKEQYDSLCMLLTYYEQTENRYELHYELYKKLVQFQNELDNSELL